MKFWKYHGLGNDFIMLNNMDGQISISSQKVEALCHRRFGIGADGVILAEPSKTADVRMIIYNSDGSRAEMCGNGIRCFAKFVFDKGIVRKNNIAVETDAGIMNIEVRLENDKVKTAVVNMGQPEFTASRVPVLLNATKVINHEIQVEGSKYKITSLLMGVPHTVIFVDNLDDEMVQCLGKKIENLEIFPNKTNVNFVKVIDRNEIVIRTWERGAGYTYACGTGACASVAAAAVNNLINDKVKVQLRGGALVIEWKDRKNMYMEGPAEEVYEGNYLNF